MPNRVLKESIKRSPQIDSLTWFEEVIFLRLIVTVDDHGRYWASPICLRNDLFPMKESITKKSIEDALRRLAELKLITLYTVEGVEYLCLTTWEKHQRVRTKVEKFPAPPFAASCGKLQQVAADCGELRQNVALIQSESKYESISKSKSNKTTKTFNSVGLSAHAREEEIEGQKPEEADVYDCMLDLLPGASDDLLWAEAKKFFAFNEYHGWACLPKWREAVAIWCARMGEK